ncbi:MAG: NeuD/PglB/VioB family sugar acetyltransferase [Anaerolineales bacterium]
MDQIPVPVPLLNANEPEARLVALHVQNGQRVEKDALLFTIETTKAAADVESPAAGFVRILAAQGETFAVGDVLAFITATADENIDQTPRSLPTVSQPDTTSKPGSPAPAGLRITRPARALAESIGLDLAELPTDRLVTEAVIRNLQPAAPASPAPPPTDFSTSQLILYGAGGHAKTVLEMAQAIGAFRIAGIIDDNAALTRTSVLGIPVLGTRAVLPQLVAQGIHLAANGVGGIIDIGVRIRLFELLVNSGFSFPILRHPRAAVEASARIADGVQVFANAYVGSEAILHERCMVNTGAVVSHDCEIGAYTHIAPGALLAGHVHVGERALVGMGVTTIIGLKIGAGARIGNGAVLLADVPEKAIIPAGKVWTA